MLEITLSSLLNSLSRALEDAVRSEDSDTQGKEKTRQIEFFWWNDHTIIKSK